MAFYRVQGTVVLWSTHPDMDSIDNLGRPRGPSPLRWASDGALSFMSDDIVRVIYPRSVKGDGAVDGLNCSQVHYASQRDDIDKQEEEEVEEDEDDDDKEENDEEDSDIKAHSKGRVRARKRLRPLDAAGRGEGGSLAENIAACRFSDHEEEDYLESDEGTAGKRRQLVSQTKLSTFSCIVATAWSPAFEVASTRREVERSCALATLDSSGALTIYPPPKNEYDCARYKWLADAALSAHVSCLLSEAKESLEDSISKASSGDSNMRGSSSRRRQRLSRPQFHAISWSSISPWGDSYSREDKKNGVQSELAVGGRYGVVVLSIPCSESNYGRWKEKETEASRILCIKNFLLPSSLSNDSCGYSSSSCAGMSSLAWLKDPNGIFQYDADELTSSKLNIFVSLMASILVCGFDDGSIIVYQLTKKAHGSINIDGSCNEKKEEADATIASGDSHGSQHELVLIASLKCHRQSSVTPPGSPIQCIDASVIRYNKEKDGHARIAITAAMDSHLFRWVLEVGKSNPSLTNVLSATVESGCTVIKAHNHRISQIQFLKRAESTTTIASSSSSPPNSRSLSSSRPSLLTAGQDGAIYKWDFGEEDSQIKQSSDAKTRLLIFSGGDCDLRQPEISTEAPANSLSSPATQISNFKDSAVLRTRCPRRICITAMANTDQGENSTQSVGDYIKPLQIAGVAVSPHGAAISKFTIIPGESHNSHENQSQRSLQFLRTRLEMRPT